MKKQDAIECAKNSAKFWTRPYIVWVKHYKKKFLRPRKSSEYGSISLCDLNILAEAGLNDPTHIKILTICPDGTIIQ